MALDREALLFAAFDAAALAAAQERPEVDPELAMELMREAAARLHNGLALDGLGERDYPVVVAALATDLVSLDPTAAVRARAAEAGVSAGVYEDPDEVRATVLIAASVLQL